nr:uridine diphosphate-glycosyltransferases 40AW1 [Glyphodes pyloalis]
MLHSKMTNLFILISCLCLSVCSSYKILVVFPIPGSSHAILGEGFVRHLLEAGHEVTYITPVLLKNPSPKLRQVDVSANFQAMPLEQVLNLEKLMKKEVDMTDMNFVKGLMMTIANVTITNPNVRRLMEDRQNTFDVVVAEWLYTELYSGFSSVFKCPLVWSSSMDPHAMVLWLIDEGPNPAYIADHLSPENPPFTFWQRVNELWNILRWMKLAWSTKGLEEAIYNGGYGPSAAKRGVELSPLSQVKYNGSLMLGNSHIAMGQPVRLPQNYKPILGYHIAEKVKPLPENLQTIMDKAEHGVIYFSMGSMLKSKTLPDKLKKELLETFAGFKQTVIWKFEDKLPNLPPNVHIVNWAQQQSVLAHPNCMLFITHGGLLSLTETIHFGVPVIGIPMFADQFLNVNRAVIKGFGLKVHLDWDVAKNLKAAIEEILGNPRYHERVKEISFIYHHRPAPPGTELVHWVEHVVRTGGAPHMRSAALDMPFYQKTYLDLAAVILIVVLSLIYVLKLVLASKTTRDLNKKNR